MREAASRKVRASTARERAGGTKASVNPLGESRFSKNLVRRPCVFLVAVLAGHWLCSDDVVGLDPSGRADRETGLGTRGKLARGLAVDAKEGGLCRSQIGLRV